jgi:SAM-dependent methyltransferase
MNRAHAPLTNLALARIPFPDCQCVLDIGCGGGAALSKLANLLPEAKLHGIDYSPESLAVAARTNRQLIRQGRVFLREASVSHLPYEDGFFDFAVAIESHYFWPDLQHDLREIWRVLRAGGTVVLAGAVYFGGKFDSRNRKLAAKGGMNCQTLSELREAVGGAGYADVVVHEEWDRGWFCVTGRKPLGEAAEARSVN